MSAAEHAQPPRAQIAVAVVEHRGRFLIGRREAGRPLEGYWEFPGGKMQSHETPAAAAVRECLEETGLLVRVVGDYAPAEYDYPHALVRLHFLACESAEQQRPLPPRFRWVSRAELSQFTFPPANARLLEELAASDPQHG
jgi:mutator protein MutT